ncbi:MAG: hypothetical protein Q8M31_05245 [Beijerinckiaceae bacterium]|nr:hypothetical protein [Beijerinckiaceae bacterium]
MANAATTGALIGLVVGGLHYIVTVAVMGSIASRTAPNEDLPGLPMLAARLRRIKLAMLGVCFLLFPLVGYAAGAMLSQGEAR